MPHVNYEFKAVAKDHRPLRAILKKLKARSPGIDHQIDTYFRIPEGRLKIRQGNIENSLIFYRRTNNARARQSRIRMIAMSPQEAKTVKDILSAALGVRAVVDKKREIYFVGNVKIHLDRVRGLGKFIEVEAINDLQIGGRRVKTRPARIREEALEFQRLFGIENSDIMAESYSDMVLRYKRP